MRWLWGEGAKWFWFVFFGEGGHGQNKTFSDAFLMSTRAQGGGIRCSQVYSAAV